MLSEVVIHILSTTYPVSIRTNRMMKNYINDKHSLLICEVPSTLRISSEWLMMFHFN